MNLEIKSFKQRREDSQFAALLAEPFDTEDEFLLPGNGKLKVTVLQDIGEEGTVYFRHGNFVLEGADGDPVFTTGQSFFVYGWKGSPISVLPTHCHVAVRTGLGTFKKIAGGDLP